MHTIIERPPRRDVANWRFQHESAKRFLGGVWISSHARNDNFFCVEGEPLKKFMIYTEVFRHVLTYPSFTIERQAFEKGESMPGTPSNPSLRNIMAVAQVLGVRLDELVPGSWPDLRAGSKTR